MSGRVPSSTHGSNGHRCGNQYDYWLKPPALYDHVLKHIAPETGRLQQNGQNLPDDARVYASGRFPCVPGAWDSAIAHEESPALACVVAQHAVAVARYNKGEDRKALYELLLHDELLSFADLAVDKLLESGASSTPYLREFARQVAMKAPDRGPVKFAITLLGIFGDKSDTAVISLLGLHEEFTLYSSIALSNLLPDPEAELWDLAKKVDGWGKVHLVRQLAVSPSPEIKDWLLREGFRNNVLENVAWDCAIGGDLRAALSAEDIDVHLLEAAGEILWSLEASGPFPGLDDYPDAAFVVTEYLRHVKARADKLQHLVTSHAIRCYLTVPDWDEEGRLRNGWTAESRALAIQSTDEILDWPRWTGIVRRGLAGEDDREFDLADRAAEILGLDTWDVHWARLREDPLQRSRWGKVMRQANLTNIAQILGLASEVLPLDQLGAGVDDRTLSSPESAFLGCLVTIVSYLRHYPFHGWPLVLVALRSPVAQHRRIALNTIRAWKQLPDEIRRALIEAQRAEPRNSIQAQIVGLLSEESGEPPLGQPARDGDSLASE